MQRRIFQNRWWKLRRGRQVYPVSFTNEGTFEGLDEGKGKTLVGGILLKTREIVTKYERLLLGDIISFGSISGTPMGLNLR
jgi:hypothetical protein